MEKRIKSYRKYMDELLEKGEADWERVREEHLTQIGFFQHERLIHLIVTVLFALLTMLAIGFSCLMTETESGSGMAFLLLSVLLLVLLVPYIRHYYILENEVQRMYQQYDSIVGKIDGMEFMFRQTKISE